jgi:hypothetical protein
MLTARSAPHQVLRCLEVLGLVMSGGLGACGDGGVDTQSGDRNSAKLADAGAFLSMGLSDLATRRL